MYINISLIDIEDEILASDIQSISSEPSQLSVSEHIKCNSVI